MPSVRAWSTDLAGAGWPEPCGGLPPLPVLPDFGPRAHQFTVREADFAAAVLALALADQLPSLPVGIAHPDPVPFTELLASFAASQGKPSPRYVPTPPMAVYGALRAAELLPFHLPVRADSLLGLVRPAPDVPNLEVLEGLGIACSRSHWGHRSLPSWEPNGDLLKRQQDFR